MIIIILEKKNENREYAKGLNGTSIVIEICYIIYLYKFQWVIFFVLTHLTFNDIVVVRNKGITVATVHIYAIVLKYASVLIYMYFTTYHPD